MMQGEDDRQCRDLAGLALPDWVGPQLESALKKCENGFDSAWLLSDQADDIEVAIWKIDQHLFKLDALTRMPVTHVTRAELQEVTLAAIGLLEELREALPDPGELRLWADSLDGARSEVRKYLVRRAAFKLRLGGGTRSVDI